MSLNKAATGPVDVLAFLADRKAGKVTPRTASVDVYLEPAATAEYDDLIERYNAIVIESKEAAQAAKGDRLASEPADPYAAQLDQLEAQIAEAEAALAGQKVTLTFHGYTVGDQSAINEAAKPYLNTPQQNEQLLIISAAQYLQEPKLSADDLRELIPVIGFGQWQKATAVFQELVYGAPTGPKSRKPLLTRGTTKR